MRLVLRPALLLLTLATVAGCVVAPYPPHVRHGYGHGHHAYRHAGPPPYGHHAYGPPRHWHRPPGHYRGW